MYSCNLLADTRQVDLRFNAYFGEYFWVIEATGRNSSISVVKSGLCAAGRQALNHPRLRIITLLRTSCIFSSFITNSIPDVTTSPVTSPRPPKSTPRARDYRVGGSCARQLVEVLLQNWSTVWRNLDTSDERLFALRLTKHVAIHAAFPYNRDQGADKFRCLPYFAGERPRLSSA